MAFDKEILPIQIEQLFRQLVDNCALNLSDFSATNVPWARFLWGHPDRCEIPDRNRPVVFLYGFSINDAQDSLCSYETTISAVLGVHAFCNTLSEITNGVTKFENLWYSIQRRFDPRGFKTTLPGTYQIEQHDSTKIQYVSSRFGDMGFSSIELLGNNALEIDNGIIKRYQKQIELKLSFAAPVLQVGGHGLAITTV